MSDENNIQLVGDSDYRFEVITLRDGSMNIATIYCRGKAIANSLRFRDDKEAWTWLEGFANGMSHIKSLTNIKGE